MARSATLSEADRPLVKTVRSQGERGPEGGAAVPFLSDEGVPSSDVSRFSAGSSQ